MPTATSAARSPSFALPHRGYMRARRAPLTHGRQSVAQTKADRQAAAKKGAATRKRNEQRASSQTAGKKSASTRQGKAAAGAAQDAKSAAKGAASGLAGAAKSAGSAAKQAGKSVATRAGVAKADGRKKK